VGPWTEGFIARETFMVQPEERRRRSGGIVRRYVPLVAQIMNFFQTGVAPLNADSLSISSALWSATPV